MRRNIFEHLRLDTKRELGKDWANYPVLKGYEAVILYEERRNIVKILLGVQNGSWVAGFKVSYNGNGFGFNPGLKWGKFATKRNAMLWACGYLLEFYGDKPPIAKAAKAMIEKYRQPSLFGDGEGDEC